MGTVIVFAASSPAPQPAGCATSSSTSSSSPSIQCRGTNYDGCWLSGSFVFVWLVTVTAVATAVTGHPAPAGGTVISKEWFWLDDIRAEQCPFGQPQLPGNFASLITQAWEKCLVAIFLLYDAPGVIFCHKDSHSDKADKETPELK